MRTALLHRDDPYLLEFDAEVLWHGDHKGSPAVVLDRTAFYPEGGGQPSDTGTLDGVPVLAVLADAGGRVLHVLEAPLGAVRVRGVVEGHRRHDHLQQHHGQHLLSQAFLRVAEAPTVGFHLGTEEVTIDLGRPVESRDVERAEALANQVVWEARPVQVRIVSAEEASATGVQPPDADGGVRLVEVVGFDLQACSGTHPRSTAEVGVILVTAVERYKGGSRVSFVCGDRALRAWRGRRDALDGASRQLSAPWREVPDATARLKSQLTTTERQARDLLNRFLEADARRLLAEAGAGAVVAVYDEWQPGDLRALASKIVALKPCVALLASRGAKTHLVFARSEVVSCDVADLLRRALERLGGRGGGRGAIVQGGADAAHGLEELLHGLAEEVPRLDPP